MFASPLYLDTPKGKAGAQLLVERAKLLVRARGPFFEIRNSDAFRRILAMSASMVLTTFRIRTIYWTLLWVQRGCGRR